MKKYNRYVKIVLSFFFIFLVIFLCIHFLSKGFTNSYSVCKNKIKEVYTEDEFAEINIPDDWEYLEVPSNDFVEGCTYVIYSYELDERIE